MINEDPHPNVKFSSVYQQGLLNVLLNDKSIIFDDSLALPLVLGELILEA